MSVRSKKPCRHPARIFAPLLIPRRQGRSTDIPRCRATAARPVDKPRFAPMSEEQQEQHFFFEKKEAKNFC
jgi:hypothetical protein